ncbi:MAG TPA: LytTR family DNA-binding domain-containing protein, partial [Opitutaceae bacterium]|nr:LytTR family DNA-binding domain-containing protein [Opitutaceae bacterium]
MTPLFRALIADDEPLARQGLLALLKSDPEVEVVAACADGAAARENLQLLSPDIAFVDVQMPLFDGLTVIAQLPAERRPITVVVTAYDNYAIPAFDLPAVDYVVKPFREARFREAVGRAKAAAAARRGGRPAPAPAAAVLGEPPRLAFKVARGHVLLDQRDIVWIEAAGDGVRVGEGHEVHAVRESLQHVEARLQPGRFLRVHRSFLVN